MENNQVLRPRRDYIENVLLFDLHIPANRQENGLDEKLIKLPWNTRLKRQLKRIPFVCLCWEKYKYWRANRMIGIKSILRRSRILSWIWAVLKQPIAIRNTYNELIQLNAKITQQIAAENAWIERMQTLETRVQELEELQKKDR